MVSYQSENSVSKNRPGTIRAVLAGLLVSAGAMYVGISYWSDPNYPPGTFPDEEKIAPGEIVNPISLKRLTGQETPLLPQEVTMLKKIFGDQIDYTKITVQFHDRPSGDNDAWTNLTSHIHVSPLTAAKDFTKADIEKKGTFAHEVMHVVQNQLHQHVECVRGSYADYEYTLFPNAKMSDFCDEAQGNIIKDYAMRFLFNGKSSAHREFSSSEKMLINVVENRFPQARISRLEHNGP